MADPFEGIPRHHLGVILADPAWSFKTYSDKGEGRSAEKHYRTSSLENMAALPVADLAADDCLLVMWVTWPFLKHGLTLLESWGFEYKTAAFDWIKADVSTIDLFPDPKTADMKMGYWTRSNAEPALLATRGKPKRLDAGVRMGIIEPAREHSRKPDCQYSRLERLVAGPRLELFARANRKGWTSWGWNVGKFAEVTI